MRTSDLLLAPSVTAADGDIEGMPVVVLEAMASALPVIGCEHSGIPEIVAHGSTGLIVPERDPAALAKAMEAMMDPEIRRAMGTAGRLRVETAFARSTLTERWVTLLRAAAQTSEKTGVEDHLSSKSGQ